MVCSVSVELENIRLWSSARGMGNGTGVGEGVGDGIGVGVSVTWIEGVVRGWVEVVPETDVQAPRQVIIAIHPKTNFLKKRELPFDDLVI